MALEKASFSKIHPIPSVLGVRILCHSIFPIFCSPCDLFITEAV